MASASTAADDKNRPFLVDIPPTLRALTEEEHTAFRAVRSKWAVTTTGSLADIGVDVTPRLKWDVESANFRMVPQEEAAPPAKRKADDGAGLREVMSPAHWLYRLMCAFPGHASPVCFKGGMWWIELTHKVARTSLYVGASDSIQIHTQDKSADVPDNATELFQNDLLELLTAICTPLGVPHPYTALGALPAGCIDRFDASRDAGRSFMIKIPMFTPADFKGRDVASIPLQWEIDPTIKTPMPSHFFNRPDDDSMLRKAIHRAIRYSDSDDVHEAISSPLLLYRLWSLFGDRFKMQSSTAEARNMRSVWCVALKHTETDGDARLIFADLDGRAIIQHSGAIGFEIGFQAAASDLIDVLLLARCPSLISDAPCVAGSLPRP